MRHQILSDSDDEQVGLVKGLNQTINLQQTESFCQPSYQSDNRWRGITQPPKQLENTIDKMSTEMTKGSTSSNAQQVSQLKKHHTINNSDLIQNPKTQPLNSNQPFISEKERRRRISKEFQDRRNKFYAKLQLQFQTKFKAQLKYREDKRQERRKARQAQYTQGGFMQSIKNMFNFSKPDKKPTQ